MTLDSAVQSSAPALGTTYNPFTPDQIANPYPLLAQARQDTPVFFSPMLNMWIVTRYDDITTILKDPRRFPSVSSFNVAQLDPQLQAILSAQPAPVLLIDSNPPVHTRLRGLVNVAFTPRRIALLEPRIRAIAESLVDGFVADGQADLTARFAYPLPMTVIADLFGFPHADALMVKGWSNGVLGLIGGNLTAAEQMAAFQGLGAFQAYFTAQLEQRRAQPTDDLMTDLLNAREGDQPALTIPEIVNQLSLIIIAGHETTTHLIGSMLVLLLTQPAQWAAICADPTGIPAVVEESLRVESPASSAFRITSEAVQLGGVDIPAGARLQIMLGSANRDATQFPQADAFDPAHAEQGRHLAFGWGIHFCLGAPLARLEGRIALEVLTQRLPNLRFQHAKPVAYLPSLLLRGVSELWLAWDQPA